MAGDFDEMRRLIKTDIIGFNLSLRKVVSGYSGPAIQVRRSSDNALQDIGFISNVLDETALLAFTGAGDGFVSKWYDQNNIRHFEQASNSLQPQIVASGVVIKENGKPIVSFAAGGKRLSAPSGNSFTDNEVSVYAAIKSSSGTTTAIFFEEYNDLNTIAPYLRTTIFDGVHSQKYLANYKPVVADNSILFSAQVPQNTLELVCFQNDYSSVFGYKNNVLQQSLGITDRYASTTTISIGFQTNGSFHFRGGIFEIQAFPVFHNSTDRGIIHSQINSFYTIY